MRGRAPCLRCLENVVKGLYRPLSRPLFLYVSLKALERREVREFVVFYIRNAGKLATHVKYVPLPERAHLAVQERFAGRRLGTAFGGNIVLDLPVGEIMKREPKP